MTADRQAHVSLHYTAHIAVDCSNKERSKYLRIIQKNQSVRYVCQKQEAMQVLQCKVNSVAKKKPRLILNYTCMTLSFHSHQAQEFLQVNLELLIFV